MSSRVRIVALALVRDGDRILRDETLYALDEWDAREETAGGLVVHPVSWRAIDTFGPEGGTLYPVELRELL